MIESEGKRKQITEDIVHWCNHVKATPILRKGDIGNLVHTILNEFYHISLCCGHLVRDTDEGVTIEFYEYDDHSKGTIQGLYCKECAEKYIKELGAWEIK